MIIIDHTNRRYKIRREASGENRYNGAYYYSLEIVKNIIPRIKTDRNWITLNIPGEGTEHSIFFIHNNLKPERYEWIRQYGFKDMVLVCGIEETCEKVKHLGRPIYLPLSIDTNYVHKFKTEKTKGAAFAGRLKKRDLGTLPRGIDYLHSMEREDLLRSMAPYKTIFSVGRTAIEARALGCEIMPYDKRFPDPSIWRVLDNRDAAKILQQKLDEIDG